MKKIMILFIFLFSSKLSFAQDLFSNKTLKKNKIEFEIYEEIDLNNSFGFGEGLVSNKFSKEFKKNNLIVKSENPRYFISISYGWSFKNKIDLVVESFKGVIIDKENEDKILATFLSDKAKEIDYVVEIVVKNLLKFIRDKSINTKNKFIDINDHFKKMELNLWDYSRPDSHAPINITGDHFHDKGGLMISYRYILKNMSGNLNGNSEVEIDDILNNYNSISESNKIESHKVGFMYGISRKINLMTSIGFTLKTMNLLSKKNQAFQVSSSGVEDINFFGLYSLIDKSMNKTHLNIGVSFPVGSINSNDNFSSFSITKLPYNMQIGSGTWNTRLGLTTFFQLEKISFGLQPSYNIYIGKNSFNYSFGNDLDINYWAALKISNWISVSLNLQNKFSDKIRGKDPELTTTIVTESNAYNYGFYVFNSSIGINIIPPFGKLKKIRIGIEYFLPLLQNYNGIQMGLDNSFLIGLQFSPGSNKHH